MHLRHVWDVIETVGRVIVQRCTRCGKIRVRAN